MSCLSRLVILLLLPLPWLSCSDSSAEGAVVPARQEVPEVRVLVRTAHVEHATLNSPDRVSGTVRAFHEATVKAETNGRVLRRVVERGDSVAKGDPLIELDASRLELELRQTEATLRSRRTDLAHAKREHARGESLVAQDAISEQRRDDLQHALDAARNSHALAVVARDTAQRMLDDATICSPIDGRVDDLLVDVGDYVGAGSPVAHLLDLSRVRIFGGVTAEEAARLSPGMRATANFASLGGLSQKAELRNVARAADREDGTYQVELWIDDPDPLLRDGMVASLELADERDSQRPLVPRAALVRRAGRSEVFVVERTGGASSGVAKRRTVRTGRTGAQRVEILDGLAPGDEVVVDGQFALRDGSAVDVEAQTTEPASAK